MQIQLAFYKAPGTLMSKIIRLWTKSKYSHVEMIIGDRWISSDAGHGGVRILPLRPLNDDWDYVTINVDGRVKRKVLKFIEDNKDAEYDWAGLFLGTVFNISAEDCDIGIGDANAKRWLRTGKCSFLPEERAWFKALLDLGFTDSYRHIYPSNNDQFSWFDYRSKGFEDTPKRGLRIDGVLCSDNLVPFLSQAGISYEIRAMEKPSDHAPIWAELDI